MRKLGMIMAAAAALAGCGKSGETASTEAAPAAPPPAELTEAEQQVLLAALPAPYNTGDLANGKTRFLMCRSCHTLNEGGPNMTGPNLYGLFGRAAGTHGPYRYSEALKASGIVWDAATLDKWLADPRADVPGNKMTFPGLKDPKDRIDVIAYLKVETSPKPGA